MLEIRLLQLTLMKLENNRSRKFNGVQISHGACNQKLDLEHHLFLLTFDGKLALAPVGNQVHRVLDVGTGTGHWAIDFAEDHPESEVRTTPPCPRLRIIWQLTLNYLGHRRRSQPCATGIVCFPQFPFSYSASLSPGFNM